MIKFKLHCLVTIATLTLGLATISKQSQAQKINHNADYYFEQANHFMAIPGVESDSLERNCILLYSKAIELNPKFWQAYRNRSRFYSGFKLYKNAISDLTNAIKYCKASVNFDLYIDRGMNYYADGKYQYAIKDFNHAIPIDGNPAQLYLIRAKSYWKLGFKQKACEDYKAALKRRPSLSSEKEFLNCN